MPRFDTTSPVKVGDPAAIDIADFLRSARNIAKHALMCTPSTPELEQEVRTWYSCATGRDIAESKLSEEKGLLSSEAKTDLAGVLVDQPWRNYALGDSVDAITGQQAVRAVNPFELTHDGIFDYRLQSSTVTNEQSFNQVFTAEVSGSYNADFKVSASSSFLSSITFSSNSYTVLVSAEILSRDTGTPVPALSLTAAATSLAKERPQEFRKTFGDYVVAGATVGSRLLVSYRFFASSSEKLLEFQAKVGGGNEFFTAEGATSLKQKSESLNVSVEMSVYVEGVSGAMPPTSSNPEDIPKILEWFIAKKEDGSYENITPVARRARLEHFANLDINLPRVVAVDPKVFGNIQALHFRIEQLATLINVLPNYYSNQESPVPSYTFGELATFLRTQFAASGPSLPYDTALIDEMGEQADLAMNALAPAVALVALYENLTANPPFEGEKGNSSEATFGYVSLSSGLPKVESIEKEVHESYTFAGYTKHTFNWPFSEVGANQIACGWKIELLNKNSRGDWKRLTSVIGKSNGQIFVESGLTRWLEVRLTVYYIPLSAFPWIQQPSELEDNSI